MHVEHQASGQDKARGQRVDGEDGRVGRNTPISCRLGNQAQQHRKGAITLQIYAKLSALKGKATAQSDQAQQQFLYPDPWVVGQKSHKPGPHRLDFFSQDQ